MKERIITLIVIVALSITSVFVLNSFTENYAEADSKKAKPNFTYTVKQYENHIALYKDDKLMEIYKTVDYNSLPEYDKNVLKKGIGFNNINDIDKLIEDYDG